MTFLANVRNECINFIIILYGFTNKLINELITNSNQINRILFQIRCDCPSIDASNDQTQRYCRQLSQSADDGLIVSDHKHNDRLVQWYCLRIAFASVRPNASRRRPELADHMSVEMARRLLRTIDARLHVSQGCQSNFLATFVCMNQTANDS